MTTPTPCFLSGRKDRMKKLIELWFWLYAASVLVIALLFLS